MGNSTLVRLKTIADIENEKTIFYIDAYQRGYRWTESEVRDLLDDIHEFSQSGYENSDRFYCLQPIIITKTLDGNAWKVIDGQQRMTTLYLIYLYYVNTAGRMKPALPFELHYNGKDRLEECLAEIKENAYYEESELENAKSNYGDDIDCYFVLTAYTEICKFFNTMYENAQIRNRIFDMKKVFDNFMKIIWYELIDCDEQTEISMFTKINMGKIPLTNAELIKALLLRAEDDDISAFQENIAIKWDEMESQLSEPGFWAFLVNDSSIYSTRIDFIFEIMAREINETELKKASSDVGEQYYIEQAYNKQYFSFYVFNNYVRYLKKNNSDIDYVEEIWTKINEYYQMFRDWYQNRKWYHLIGFIVETSGKKYIEKLSELSVLYKSGANNNNQAGHKTLFENNLRKMITKQIDNEDSFTSQDLKDYITSKLKYGDTNEAIKNILLLYNISSLELLEEQTDARFPFDKYKSRDIIWDIEHINAVADDRPSDTYDRDNNACKIWLENTRPMPHIHDLKLPSGEAVDDAIDRILSGKLYLPQNEAGTTSFISVYECVIKYFGDSDETDNSIANLTLLDSGTNRSYKNDIFPLKRKKILENCTKEIYIPLCTKNVFLKAYLQANDLLKWTQNDKDSYVADIVEKISSYLRLEVEQDGN